ncbi:MAG: two-component regulator propeller domain-containing protein [Bacteroidota bacterium]
MLINVKKYFLLCVLAISSQTSFGQVGNYLEEWRWVHFTKEDGLPSNIIFDVVESSDGGVWASTLSGIAWYDGFRWNKIDSAMGLPEVQPQKMCINSSGMLSVVINGKIYVGNKNGFQKIDIPEDIAIMDSRIFAANYRSDSLMIIQTTIKISETYFYSHGGVSKSHAKTPTPVTGLWCTKSGRIIINSHNGLFYWSENSWKNIWDYETTHERFIRSVVENESGYGAITIDSPKEEIGVWQYQNRKRYYQHSSQIYQPVRTIDISNDGNIFAVFESGDVKEKGKNDWMQITPVPKQLTGVLFVKYRSNNDLWVGTDHGLFLHRTTGSPWTMLRHKDPDSRNIVMEIFKDRKNTIWIGTANGLEIREPGMPVRYISHIQSKPLGLITGINEDEQGVWISSGANFEGAYCFNGKFWKHYGRAEGLHAQRVHKIRKDSKGRLWFLGLGATEKDKDPGAFVYEKGKFKNINVDNGLLHNRVYSFAETKSGSLWFGTSNGLSKYDNGTWKYWKTPSERFYVLEIDKQDRVWFSNFNSKIGFIDGNDSMQFVWNVNEENYYSQKVWDIQSDENDVLWVATTKGLFSYQDSIWTHLNADAGASLRELRVVLPIKDKVWVGGHGSGIGVLDRSLTNIPLEIHIRKPINEESHTHFEWSVAAHWGLIISQDIETRYCITGKGWSQWTKDRKLSIANSLFGRLTLKVQAKHPYSSEVQSEEVISYYIQPPFYLSPAFISVNGAVLVVILTLVLRNERQKKIYELKVQRNSERISSDLHDEIGSNLGTIALLSQRLFHDKNLTRTAKNDLSLITKTSLETANYLQDIVWYTDPKHDTSDNLVYHLKEIAEVMLKGKKIYLHISGDAKDLDSRIVIRRNIYLIFKEILHNIIKHSNATTVEIIFFKNIDSFGIDIREDGVGFDITKIKRGNGLNNIELRAKEVGGEIIIHSIPEIGTSISVTFKNHVNT